VSALEAAIPATALPLVASAVGVLVLLAASLLPFGRKRHGDLALLVFAIVAASAVVSMEAPDGWVGTRRLAADPFANFFHLALALTAAAFAWLSTREASPSARPAWFFWPAVATSLLGMQAMAAATDAVAVWAGFELGNVSCALALAAQGRDARTAAASALLRGALASAMLVAGFALLLGVSGAADYPGLASRLSLAVSMPGGRAASTAGVVMVAAALTSRMAIAPWLLWPAVDAVRTPLPLAAWTLTGGSLAALASLSRFLASAVTTSREGGVWTTSAAIAWAPLLSVAATGTMLFAAAALLREANLRRLLAWLAVAHGGWVAMGLATATDGGLAAAMAAAVTNALALLGLTAVLESVPAVSGGASVDAIRGLARRSGLARAQAAAVLFFLASLAGLPFLAGHAARSALFAAAIAAGRWGVVVGAIAAAAIGWMAVLRVAAILLDRHSGEPQASESADGDALALAALLAVALLGLGLVPSGLFSFAARSVVFFGG
jgi:NADH-quinone oxidoreductase subunit N